MHKTTKAGRNKVYRKLHSSALNTETLSINHSTAPVTNERPEAPAPTTRPAPPASKRAWPPKTAPTRGTATASTLYPPERAPPVRALSSHLLAPEPLSQTFPFADAKSPSQISNSSTIQKADFSSVSTNSEYSGRRIGQAALIERRSHSPPSQSLQSFFSNHDVARDAPILPETFATQDEKKSITMSTLSADTLLAALSRMGLVEQVQDIIADQAVEAAAPSNQANRKEGGESGADMSGWLQAQHKYDHSARNTVSRPDSSNSPQVHELLGQEHD